MKHLTLILVLTFAEICSGARPFNFDWKKLDSIITTEHIVGFREKRSGSLFVYFAKALHDVLKKSIYSHVSDGCSVFTKPGGYRQALEDFISLKPSGVYVSRVTSGFVGGRRLVLDGGSKEPYLMISRINQADTPELIIKYAKKIID